MSTVCPVCKNTLGFAFGTCCQCGYNYLQHGFRTVEVDVDLLYLLGINEKDIFNIIDKHYEKYRMIGGTIKEQE